MQTARDTLVHFLQGTCARGPLSEDQQRELFREGMLGLACRQRGLKEELLRAVGREYRWRALLEELDQALAEAGQRAIVFKGGATLGHLYPGSGLRPLSDLDLVAGRECEEVLCGLGFETLTRHPWVMTRSGFQLDLHQHPLSRHQHVFPWDLRRAGQLSLPLTEKHGLFRYRLEDETVLCLLHAGKHAYSRFIWLADLHLLLPRCQPEVLRERLREARAERYLDYARWLLANLTGQARPRLSRLEEGLLELCLNRQTSESLGMILPLAWPRSWPRAGRYLWHCLRPQSGRDWRRRLAELYALALRFRRSATG